MQANVRDADSVRRSLDGAHACVNLVGVLFERGRQGFQALHATAPRTIAEAAASLGVERLVHISAIGADPNGSAKYAQTKAAGETAVREAFPSATILRPSVVFGAEDDFFNRFGAMAALSPVLPLIGGGATRFQPVYVGDVGEAIAQALDDRATAGRTYELGGPAVYTFRQIMEVVLRETLRSRALVPIPFPLARLMGRAGDIQGAILPFAPQITSDQIELLRHDNVVSPGTDGLAALGVQPTALDAVLPTYMWTYRKGGQFAQPAQDNAEG